ncbi:MULTISPECIES: SMI1/KNR4 family protein [Yersinia]|uniref:SMI1/KNR4 family protein n=1 Tax=Yersinia TaxID=629 RepID=UPI001CFC47B9|nr:SMI1/KNR4 family protein [Yersinia intermedia]ELX2276439.1 SMI1/KNR4 family protein [Yersinia enterocolitica]MCB5311489.1 SMI1/KNR4 family protein [Yersinia intermedia]MCB5325622.1 SMI1/KNR4 family protein [Yersinia intermedia]
MKQLKTFIEEHDVIIRPVDAATINAAEQTLHITFTPDYKAWLSNVGILSYEATEVFGLGVNETAWLSILRSTVELRQQHPNFPTSAVPLMDAEDGQYYLYDNATGKIVRWSPLSGVLETLNDSLESFVLKQVEH